MLIKRSTDRFQIGDKIFCDPQGSSYVSLCCNAAKFRSLGVTPLVTNKLSSPTHNPLALLRSRQDIITRSVFFHAYYKGFKLPRRYSTVFFRIFPLNQAYFSAVFSGRQQCQDVKVLRIFRDGVSPCKVGEPSHIDAALCLRTFY